MTKPQRSTEAQMKCYKMYDERAAATRARILAKVGEFAYYRQADRQKADAARRLKERKRG